MSENEMMEKLEEIEKKVAHIEKMEETQINEENKIEKEEEKELDDLKDATKKLRFTDIVEWQKYIWEGCEFKKEVKGSEEVDYFCEKQKAPCKFEGCPLNIQGTDD